MGTERPDPTLNMIPRTLLVLEPLLGSNLKTTSAISQNVKLGKVCRDTICFHQWAVERTSYRFRPELTAHKNAYGSTNQKPSETASVPHSHTARHLRGTPTRFCSDSMRGPRNLDSN